MTAPQLSVSTGFMVGAYAWPGEYLQYNRAVPAYSATPMPGLRRDSEAEYPFGLEGEGQ